MARKKEITPEELAKKLNVQKIPDLPPDRGYKYRGKTSGLGLLRWWKTLLLANEVLGTDSKMTSTELERQTKEEFSPFKKLISSMEDSKSVSAQYYRTLFNRRKLEKPWGQKPIYTSFRYNTLGEIVEPRRGNRILSNEEIVELMLLYKTKEEVWEEITLRGWEEDLKDEFNILTAKEMEKRLC